ncbi:hypothetical protein HYFRA_00001586 [Hymenoscyphus fraxineus]|uniref:2EXR domain-containing protein n=1 Tax=Hymenoscyphus fraxineus TaxID=746836 RepID=A0A9N9L461_9HELO|nr:hypothetical protein HYFRA_00001586 [Hymenoscyphus fraxineus]
MSSPAGAQDAATVVAPASLKGPTQALTEFTLFPKLCKELQLMIWDEYKRIPRVIKLSTRHIKNNAGIPNDLCPKLEYYVRSLAPNPLSSTCRDSREMMKNKQRCAWAELGHDLPDLGNFYFHPSSAFLFNAEQLRHIYCYPIRSSAWIENEIFKATAVKVLAIRSPFEDLLKTTARLSRSLAYENFPNTLEAFLGLERLILIRPSWLEKADRTLDARLKRNSNKKLLDLKHKVETEPLSCEASAKDYKRELESHGNIDLTMSLWWKNPKVEIMSEAEFASLY